MQLDDMFECFFVDEVISLSVTETNRYANQNNGHVRVGEEEIRCFLSILLLSGYVVIPSRLHCANQKISAMR